MPENIPKERLEAFDRLIKALGIALTSSALYPPNHPSSVAVMDSLKEVLDIYLRDDPRAEIGISPDNIMLNGAFVREKSDLFRTVADHLHRKGVVAISFLRGVEMAELVKLFGALSQSTSEKGGAAKKIGALPHIVVKEVDYSSMLTSANSSSAMREQDIWRSLSDLGKDLKGGRLPASRIEFMTEFLKDSGRAASVLNAIYRDAAARLEGQATVTEVRDVFSRINRYFDGEAPGRSGRTKRDLSEIISRLDPEFIVTLLGDRLSGDASPDLAEEIFKVLPDEDISDFIYSVVKGGGGVTEKLVKVFSRISPAGERRESVLSMAADKLFAGHLIGRGGLSVFQDSIKGLFESHPDDDFVSQLYDITVRAFLDKEKGPDEAGGRYSAIRREYADFLKPDSLSRERIRLILNMIWLETDPSRFIAMCAMLADSFGLIPAAHYATTVREAFELLTEKLAKDRRVEGVISEAVKATLDGIDTAEVAGRLMELIPGSDRERLNDIAYVLTRSKGSPANDLLGLFVAEKDDPSREHYGYVLSRFDDRISKEIVSRIDDALRLRRHDTVRALYGVLKDVAFHEAHFVAGRLIKDGGTRIRSWLLDEYCPATDEEKASALEAIRREYDAGIKNKLLIALVRTKDAAVVNKLFGIFGGGVFVSRHMVDLVTLCGTFRVAGAIPSLKEVLGRRRFPYIGAARKVRAQAVLSLARIGRPEGIECVIKAENDPDPSVRVMCKIALGGAGAGRERPK
jgi:hypothetical protein